MVNLFNKFYIKVNRVTMHKLNRKNETFKRKVGETSDGKVITEVRLADDREVLVVMEGTNGTDYELYPSDVFRVAYFKSEKPGLVER